MINQIKTVMFVQDAERKAWLGILQKQRCPVFPVTTRNRAEQAQHGRWLFKINRVGGSCAGCPQLRLSPHAVLCWERRGRQNFPNFPGRNRRAGEDFLLQLTLRREGSREQLFTCCQDFLLWSCLESDNWTVNWKTKRRVFYADSTRYGKVVFFLLSFGKHLNYTTFPLVISYSGAALTCLLFDRCQRGRPPWVQRVANRNTPRPGYEGWISQLCLEWRVAYR